MNSFKNNLFSALTAVGEVDMLRINGIIIIGEI